MPALPHTLRSHGRLARCAAWVLLVVLLTVAARLGLWLLVAAALQVMGWRVMWTRIDRNRRVATTVALAESLAPCLRNSEEHERCIGALVRAASGTAGAEARQATLALLHGDPGVDRWKAALAADRLDSAPRAERPLLTARMMVAAVGAAASAGVAIAALSRSPVWLACTLMLMPVLGAALAVVHDRRHRLPIQLLDLTTIPPWRSAVEIEPEHVHASIAVFAGDRAVLAAAAARTTDPAAQSRLQHAMALSTEPRRGLGRLDVVGTAVLAAGMTTPLSHLVL